MFRQKKQEDNVLLSAIHAFDALLKILLLPAIGMVAGGAYLWKKSSAIHHADKMRLGKMLLMFGVIFTAILLIVLWVLRLQFGIS